jgi:hypothetical protein
MPEVLPNRDYSNFNPWARRRGFRWFIVSAVVHVGLLAALATISLTAIRAIQQIRVKIVEPESLVDTDMDEAEGVPSLRELAGVFRMEPAPRRPANPGGPVVRNVRAPQMPHISGLGAMIGRAPGLESEPLPLGVGSGGIGGLGGGFGDYVGGLRKVGLDLVLVIDTTKSMGFVIDAVKHQLTDLTVAMRRMVPTSRVGVVAYRDRGDEYLVRWNDLTFRSDKLQDFLNGLSAWGGGDWEEAVKDGLDTAFNDMKWRKKAQRIVILVGGSPPHPEDIPAIREMVQAFRASGGYLSTIDVTEHLHVEEQRYVWRSEGAKGPFEPGPMPKYYHETAKAFGALAELGGGELVQLDDEKKLVRDVVMLTFGGRWKIEMAKYLKDLS